MKIDNKKKALLILLTITTIIITSGCISEQDNKANNTTETVNAQNTTVFQVDGNITDLDDTGFKIPLHKTVDYTIYFYYTPYKDGVPEMGSYCIVPQGIDTTQTFKLSVLDPYMGEYDQVLIRACSDEYGQDTIQSYMVNLR